MYHKQRGGVIKIIPRLSWSGLYFARLSALLCSLQGAVTKSDSTFIWYYKIAKALYKYYNKNNFCGKQKWTLKLKMPFNQR